MLVAMSDSEFQENLLRDLCAASNFGFIDALLADFRSLNVNQPAQPSSPPKRPPTLIRSRGRFKGKLIVSINVARWCILGFLEMVIVCFILGEEKRRWKEFISCEKEAS